MAARVWERKISVPVVLVLVALLGGWQRLCVATFITVVAFLIWYGLHLSRSVLTARLLVLILVALSYGLQRAAFAGCLMVIVEGMMRMLPPADSPKVSSGLN